MKKALIILGIAILLFVLGPICGIIRWNTILFCSNNFNLVGRFQAKNRAKEYMNLEYPDLKLE